MLFTAIVVMLFTLSGGYDSTVTASELNLTTGLQTGRLKAWRAHGGLEIKHSVGTRNFVSLGYDGLNEAITVDSHPARREGEIRFDRNELAGAFGDIGTDLPLIVGMIIAAKLDSASVLVLFGAMQVLTALRYRMPMPVQPLKAVAALVITQKLSGSLLYGGGLAIGLLMLALTLTGSINWLARVVPKAVVRGIQFGLGLQLTTLALRQYVQADGVRGYALAALAFVIMKFITK